MSAIIPTVFLVIGALALLAAIYFTWQSVRAALGVVEVGGGDTGGIERARLLERKEATLQGIADLRFEHEAGKIDDGDFEELYDQMRGEAKAILHALDDELGEYREQADQLIEEHLSGASGGKKKRKKGKQGKKAAKPKADKAELDAGEEGAASRALSSDDAPADPDEDEGEETDPTETDPGEGGRRRSRPATSESGSIDNHLLCPICMAPNAPESLHCCECHARVAPVPCASCETVNDADATFCKKCGAALEENEQLLEDES